MQEVQTIQGLNLESQYTTVRIPLSEKNLGQVNDLIDKIASFHPIFIKEYLLSPTLLTVRSKLPFLWRESAETLFKLSNSEISLKEAEEYVIDTVIFKRIKSMSTIPVLEAAHNLNIETTPAVLEKMNLKNLDMGYSSTFNRYYVVGCGKGSQITCSISSSKDAYISEKIQKDKWSTNIEIERLNLPLPRWEVLNEINDIEKIWDNYKKPIVIKPTGLTGGNGVTVGINTLERAKKAYKDAQEKINAKERNSWQKKIMIQEQVKGEDYRLLVINGKLEIATKRIPAFVTGDGKLTIKELIEKENSDPRRNTKNPAHILKPIDIDNPLKDLLQEQGLTLESIPEKNSKVPVRKVASMSQGGITEDFTEKVGPEIKSIVETLAQSLHAYTLGVDVMCKDLSKPLTQDNGAILEVNTMPEAYLNFFPIIGKQRGYVAETYVKNLIAENKTRKIVVVGQNTDDIATLLRKNNFLGKSLIPKGDTVGEIKDGEYLIDGKEINENKEHWRAVEAIKCNASLDVIILHFRDWNEVSENGLGFDQIDNLIVTKDQALDNENMNLMKKYRKMRLIHKIKII